MDKDISKKLDELLKNKKTLQKGHFFVTKDVADTIKKGLAKHGTHDQSTHGGGRGEKKPLLSTPKEFKFTSRSGKTVTTGIHESGLHYAQIEDEDGTVESATTGAKTPADINRWLREHGIKSALIGARTLERYEKVTKLTIRQAKDLHGRLRSGWGRPTLTAIPTARLGRTTEGGGTVKTKKRGSTKPKGNKIRKQPVVKHLQGQHNQKDHTPKKQIAISREQAERKPTPTYQPTFELPTQVPVAVPEMEEVSREIGRGAVGAAGTAGGVVIGHALRPALGRFTRSIINWAPIAAGAAGAARRAGRLAGAVRKPKKGRRKIARRMRRSRASILRPVKKVGIRALKFLSRVRVPGAVGLGLLAAAGAYGLIRRSQTQKVRKAVGLTPGDHVLALFDPLVLIGIYIGKGKVRVVTRTSLADVKIAPQNIVLVSQGTFVPTPDSDSEKLDGLVEELNEEIKIVEKIIERAKEKPIETMNKKIGKHLQGQHDQKDHTPKATLASPKAPTAAAAPGVTRRLRPQRLSSLHNALNQINTILDGVDAGTELYNKLKGTATSITEQISQLQGPEKVMKALDAAQKAVDAALSKGISHSLTTLANATKLIREQKPNEDISGESDRKLGDIIDELGGMISYLKDVKKKGQFEKKQNYANHEEGSK